MAIIASPNRAEALARPDPKVAATPVFDGKPAAGGRAASHDSQPEAIALRNPKTGEITQAPMPTWFPPSWRTRPMDQKVYTALVSPQSVTAAVIRKIVQSPNQWVARGNSLFGRNPTPRGLGNVRDTSVAEFVAQHPELGIKARPDDQGFAFRYEP